MIFFRAAMKNIEIARLKPGTSYPLDDHAYWLTTTTVLIKMGIAVVLSVVM